MEQNLYELFSRAIPGLEIRQNEPLSRHTSFRVGGPAELLLCPKSETELARILRLCREREIRPVILGGGTNVLAPDDGVAGVVLSTKCLRDLRLTGETELRAQCGVTLSRLAMLACRHGLSGLEFAQGIPGTVGGGLYMNAGAFGGEMADVVASARVMDSDGSVHELFLPEMDLSYRKSGFMGRDCLILSAKFRLRPGDPAEIGARMREFAEKRQASQPLDKPSAGSTFKRPPNAFAAKLIQEAGLKGFRIGDAAVSEKHAGFVVNLGHATASEILCLMDRVREEVLAKFGVLLEPEVRIWKREETK